MQAVARLGGSKGSHSAPVTPASTSSWGAPSVDTTSGVPQASDSMSAMPNESETDGRQVAHARP
jgi:hypothetical protein